MNVLKFLQALGLWWRGEIEDGRYTLKPIFSITHNDKPIGEAEAGYTLTFSVKDGKVWAWGVQGDHSGKVKEYLDAIVQLGQQ